MIGDACGFLVADIDVTDVEPVVAIDEKTPLGETIVADGIIAVAIPAAPTMEPMKARMGLGGGRGEPEAQDKCRKSGGGEFAKGKVAHIRSPCGLEHVPQKLQTFVIDDML
jgi:hypothetical protein